MTNPLRKVIEYGNNISTKGMETAKIFAESSAEYGGEVAIVLSAGAATFLICKSYKIWKDTLRTIDDMLKCR